MHTNFCLSSPQDFLTMTSGGTDMQVHPTLQISSSSSTDFSDASSDDGEQLQTPVNVIDPQQLVHIAYPHDLGGPLAVDSVSKPDATGPQMQLSSEAQARSFTTPSKSISSPYKDFLGLPGAFSRSSPLSESGSSDMLCTTTLLDHRTSYNTPLNGSTLEVLSNYGTPIDIRSLSPSPANGPGYLQRECRTLEVSPSYSSKTRKRVPSNQSPLSEGKSERRPKYSRAHASEYLPSTLGSSYSARFPAGHRLRTDFVRQYRLEAELGAGGYGFVMAAKHRNDGQEVAVKFILKEKIPKHGWSRDDSGRRVPKEALLLSVVNHPGIVKFFGLFEDLEYFYLVQELHGTPWQAKKRIGSQSHQPSRNGPESPPNENTRPAIATSVKSTQLPSCTPANTPAKGECQHNALNLSLNDDPFAIDGQSLIPQPAKPKAVARPSFVRRASHDLFECIEQSKHKRFEENDAKYVFVQVVEVIEYLDSLGISHCDIKDENIVIDNNLKIKIIDFGSVVFTDPREPRPYYRRFFGTAAYASPEIMEEKPYQAAPAEVWAIGVLLSYLVTGLSPFRSEDDKRNGRITLEDAHAKRMSQQCRDLLGKCLDVDPEKRATIADIKDHPWLSDEFSGKHLD